MEHRSVASLRPSGWVFCATEKLAEASRRAPELHCELMDVVYPHFLSRSVSPPRSMSTSTTSSARSKKVLGQRLLHPYAGDAADHVVQAFEVLDVEGGPDVDAGGEQLFHVLPALRMPRPRDVGVGEAR